MFNMHPKYYKMVKIGLFQRVINGLTALVTSICTGLTLVVASPLHGFQAFIITETQIVDIDKVTEDYDKMTPKGPVGGFGDDGEDWKRAHREEYGE